MEQQFRFKNAERGPEILGDADDIFLKIAEVPTMPGMDVYFKAPTGVTTGRSFSEYKTLFPTLQVLYKQQLVEFGGGLSELTTLVAKMHHDRAPDKKPVVIDLADYQLMQSMLRFALENTHLHGLLRERRDKIEMLLERCDIILNPDMVRLSQHTIEKTLQSDPDLAGSADIAIDAFGPLRYVATEVPDVSIFHHEAARIRSAVQHILNLEQKFMKAGGMLLQRWE